MRGRSVVSSCFIAHLAPPFAVAVFCTATKIFFIFTTHDFIACLYDDGSGVHNFHFLFMLCIFTLSTSPSHLLRFVKLFTQNQHSILLHSISAASSSPSPPSSIHLERFKMFTATCCFGTPKCAHFNWIVNFTVTRSTAGIKWEMFQQRRRGWPLIVPQTRVNRFNCHKMTEHQALATESIALQPINQNTVRQINNEHSIIWRFNAIVFGVMSTSIDMDANTILMCIVRSPNEFSSSSARVWCLFISTAQNFVNECHYR